MKKLTTTTILLILFFSCTKDPVKEALGEKYTTIAGHEKMNDDLLGIDNDNNGIRDDIDLWINEEFKDADENVKNVFRQDAKNYQMILKMKNKADALKVNKFIDEAGGCSSFLFHENGPYSKYSALRFEKYTNTLHALIYNTRERLKKLEEHNEYSHMHHGGMTTGTFKNFIFRNIFCRFEIINEGAIIKSYINLVPHAFKKKNSYILDFEKEFGTKYRGLYEQYLSE